MTAEFPLAVHALVYLYKSGKVTTSNELAENICTNPARVRKVMTLLKNSGLISSGRGKDSGIWWVWRGEEVGAPYLALKSHSLVNHCP